jgi:tryptophan-rich sensory protein
LHSKTRSILTLTALLLLCYAVAAVGALSTASAIPTWYAALQKPSFNPPNWIFAPVWTVLYTLMAIAAWRIWKQPGTPSAQRRTALVAFYVQLALNFCWTPIFFKHHQIQLALIVILALWVAILVTLRLFWRICPLAGGLLLPYLAWVSFATALNAAIWHLNP